MAASRWGLLGALLLILACGDGGGTQPGALRFGQVGEVRAHLVVPLALGEGELQQVLTWSSGGAWQLYESIAYAGRVGDETYLRSRGDPGAYAGAYASLITQLNETQGLKLFLDALPPALDPVCAPLQSRVVFLIRDEIRDEEVRWTRCGYGTLGSLTPEGAGPDPAAGRVVQAVMLARDYTLGNDFVSAYLGSVPFGTLDRGEHTPAPLEGPLAFVGEGGKAPDGWASFWAAHAGAAPPPPVDWSREMVLVASVGPRGEAGDSVEVRRILPVGNATQVKLVERVPGDFCSPAARVHTPFHIVLAPRTPTPILFGEVTVERVPCGF